MGETTNQGVRNRMVRRVSLKFITPPSDIVPKTDHVGGLRITVRRLSGGRRVFGTGEARMRRLLMLSALATLALSNTGCLLNIYSSDPNRRMAELISNSEDLRQIEYEWERIWFTDEPSHMTPERVHGGIQ